MNGEPEASKSVVYQERYVAFVDVLGFRSIIAKSMDDPAVVDRVHAALAGISHLADDTRATRQGFEVTSFSDNVVLSVPVGRNWLLHLFQMINQFSQDLLGRGMLYRGAVVRGFALHTQRTIFGPAMVEAHRLESSVSFHPRVMLDAAVLLDAHRHARKNQLWQTELSRFIVEDEHDVPYLNPFASWPDSDTAWKEEAISKLFLLRTIIETGLLENAGKPDIVEKYRWLARRLDKFVGCHRLARHIPLINPG